VVQVTLDSFGGQPQSGDIRLGHAAVEDLLHTDVIGFVQTAAACNAEMAVIGLQGAFIQLR